MYSLNYKFENVFSVAYFRAGSYDDAAQIASRMRHCEGVGQILINTNRFIRVLEDTLYLYEVFIAGHPFEVYARSDNEAVARGAALMLSTKPVIRTNSTFL